MVDNDKHPPVGPLLLIPYPVVPEDTGTRPISGPPWWFCPSIHFNGTPYSGAPIDPNVAVDVSVIVANRGASGTTVSVSLYWADPTTAFINPAQLGEDWVFFLNGGNTNYETTGQNVTPAIELQKAVPPRKASSHSCLLAEISSTNDSSSGTFDVKHDRHYAQQNLSVLTGLPGQNLSFVFLAGNPLQEKGQFVLEVRPLGRENLHLLADFYHAEPVTIDRKALGLRRVRPAEIIRPLRQTTAELEPGETERLQVVIAVPEGLKPHQFVAAEVEQRYHPEGKDQRDWAIGSLGLVVFPQRE
jgi:hypothetical protein